MDSLFKKVLGLTPNLKMTAFKYLYQKLAFFQSFSQEVLFLENSGYS